MLSFYMSMLILPIYALCMWQMARQVTVQRTAAACTVNTNENTMATKRIDGGIW